jgi:hypothetical protein
MEKEGPVARVGRERNSGSDEDQSQYDTMKLGETIDHI